MADIDLITEAIAQLLKGQLPQPIRLPPDCMQEEERRLAEHMNRFLDEYRAVANAMFAVARGDVDCDVPKSKLHICQSLKNLQSNLRHLCWKAQQVARGDYRQHIDFMGNFSRDSNRLVDTLSKNRKELDRQNQALQIAARTDPLTGLANRRALDEDIQRRVSECQRTRAPLSVMLLDVDHFKDFNDTFGHRAGDEALRVIAGALRAAMREMDVVTRYGGEEFLVILPGATIDRALAVAERTRHDISQTVFRFDNREFSLTVSVGVAQFTFNEQAARMLKRADHAMYAAKKAGRNRTYWHDGRKIHAAIEESPVIWPPREQPQYAAGPLPPNLPTPTFDALPLAPWEAASLSGRESVEAMEFRFDQTAFLQQLRQRIAEWRRGGARFCLLLVCPTETESTGEEANVSLAITRIINAVVREMDAVGKCEGDRMGVLLPGTTLQEGLVAANRICRAVEVSDLSVSSTTPKFAVRIGVAEVAEGDDPIRLVQRAESALPDGERTCVR